MMKRKGAWTTKDRLEATAYVVAIVGGLCTAFVFLANARQESIRQTRATLVKSWTNEGDVTSNEIRFIDLKLENYDGDIIGSLGSPSLKFPLDVSVDVGWQSSTISITELRGRAVVPVATAKVKLSGNDNRLEWTLTSSRPPAYLPPTTVLWPLQAEVSQ